MKRLSKVKLTKPNITRIYPYLTRKRIVKCSSKPEHVLYEKKITLFNVEAANSYVHAYIVCIDIK